MGSSRRAARGRPAVPVDVDPKRIVQQRFSSPRGEATGWFKGGECYRVHLAGWVYGWGEGPDVWAALLDGSFRPDAYSNRNQ